MSKEPTKEQKQVLENTSNSLVVSASAGSGKTWIMVEYITRLVCEKNIPIKRLLVLTFTNAAAGEMKERLLKSLLEKQQSPFILQQLDDLPTADICTIDAFCQKVLKRNLDKTSLDQSFTVLDETSSAKIKLEAFENACSMAAKEQDYQYVYQCFKRNKMNIFECLCNIDNYLDCVEDSNSLIEKIKHNQASIFDDACQYLTTFYQGYFNTLLERLNKINLTNCNKKYAEVVEKLQKIIKKMKFSDFYTLVSDCQKIDLPSMPALKGINADHELAGKISAVKEKVKDGLEKLQQFDTKNIKLLENTKSGKLALCLINLYLNYKKQYEKIKQENDYQDFADIEKNCAQLLCDKTIEMEMQNEYDYVFIDEYQDTNRLQEKLIKKIAKVAKFVAVGDPKQSIYGFRNASMEIMKDDIKNANDDGVVFLRGNFRSDARILNFVNDIFKVLMREDNVGIDYSKTAMLEGLAEFKENDDKAVEVLIAKNDKQNLAENEIYSVKDAVLQQKNQNELEIDTIIATIDDLLTKKIYDVKLKDWRSVELSDITILLRGRGELMNGLETKLSSQEYSVIADNKSTITDDGEIQVLINLLKWCICDDGEVELASIMMSKLGEFSPDEMAQFVLNMQKNGEKCGNFVEFIKNSMDEKVKKLLDNIEQFKKECTIFGISRAFELLFDRTNYFAYLEYVGKTQIIEKFLSITRKSGYDFSMQNLITYLNSLSEGKLESGSSDKNAISIMTIHASKGMEFPIVILAGCGKNLSSPPKTSYEIDSRFGLSTMEYDIDELVKIKTPQLESARLTKKRREQIDELMIFYVALTRAQNKLILTGTYDLDDDYGEQDIFEGKNYFDWLFMTLDQNKINKLKTEEHLSTKFADFKVVTDVMSIGEIERENFAVNEDKNLTKKIEEYLNFSYPNIKLSKVEFKNSVTGLLKLNIEKLDEEKIEEKPQKTNIIENYGISLAEMGTIYHEIFKLVDFEKINSKEDLQACLKTLAQQNYISPQQLDVVNADYIYKDIIIIKDLLSKNNIKKIYKERPFVMKLPLSEVMQTEFTDSVLVQGIVDLFGLGDKNILIDYKFTNIDNEKILIQKYSKQLDLYAKAIEKAYKIKLDKKYLISIKNAKLIEYK